MTAPPSSAAPKEQLYKLLMVGMNGTGKTCLMRQYVHNVFQPTCKNTMGVDFSLKVLSPSDITLQIWDIAGQERFGQMTRVYYQAAVGAMVVCENHSEDSLEHAVKWKNDIDSKVFLAGTAQAIPAVLLLNKCDLGNEFMADAEVDAFAKQHGFAGWMRVSAKEGTNVNKAFAELVAHVQASQASAPEQEGDERETARSVRLTDRPGLKEEKKGGCCKKS
jgi:small GTP-binding protein